MSGSHPQPENYRGCLLGGAVGDALGAPVEFLGLPEILARFGPRGITDYVPAYGRLGAVTDDTQMTLATVRGLVCARREAAAGAVPGYTEAIYRAYREWLRMQDDPGYRRAPGNTCLPALASGRMGTPRAPLNDSKGCGGAMRVAPVGLAFAGNPDEACRVAAEAAAITHGHPTGYLSAGFLAAVIARVLGGERLRAAVEQELGLARVDRDTGLLVEEALVLADDRGKPVSEAISRLGGGWTGDEAVAIALLCCLRFPVDFEAAVIAAVNHSGDSDSTGSMAGSILGAMLGEKAIPRRWLEPLEGREEIETLAAELWRAFAQDPPSSA